MRYFLCIFSALDLVVVGFFRRTMYELVYGAAFHTCKFNLCGGFLQFIKCAATFNVSSNV